MESDAKRVIPYDGDCCNTVFACSLEYRMTESFVIPYEEDCSRYDVRNTVLVALAILYDGNRSIRHGRAVAVVFNCAVVVAVAAGADSFRRQAVAAERCCWLAIRCLSVVAAGLQTIRGFVLQTSSTPFAVYQWRSNTTLYDGNRYDTVTVVVRRKSIQHCTCSA